MDKRNVLEAAVMFAVINGGYQYRALVKENMPMEYWNLPHRSYEEHLQSLDFWQALEKASGKPDWNGKAKAIKYFYELFTQDEKHADNYLINLLAQMQ